MFWRFEKAFKRAKLNNITKVLKDEVIPTVLINTIEEINTNTTINVQTTKGLLKAIKCGSGIRQGNSASPVLFTLIMAKIIKNIKPIPG